MLVRHTLIVISLGFSLALVILFTIAFATQREWSSVDNRLFWVAHTQQVIDTLDDMEIGLRNAGVAGRDFLSQPDELHMTRFTHALADYREQMATLKRKIRDDARQQAQVRAAAVLIENKIATWQLLLQQRMSESQDSGWLTSAMKLMTISDLLDHVMAMRKSESRLLSERIAASSHSIQTGREFVLFGFVLCVSLLLGSFVYLIVQMRSRMAAEAALRRLNNSLEERIAARTHDLATANNTLREEIVANGRAREEIRQLNAGLEQRVRERTAQLEAANKELESFSYSVSHDLRTPLRAIVGFSRMLRDRMAARLDEEDARLLRVIVDNARKMANLIDDLLNFSRLGRTQLARHEVDMQVLVDSVVQDLRQQTGVETPFGAEVVVGPLPSCVGDRSLLGQVWLNLLGNALKFSSGSPSPCIQVDGVLEDGFCHYRVSDNGVGFDMRFYDKLFGVFQRLHTMEEFPGTGVGLAIVQRIINRHGGRVWAEAASGKGATFHFTVPQSTGNGSDLSQESAHAYLQSS